MRADAPLLSAFLTQQVKPTLQPSAANPHLLPHLLALPLQQDMPTIKPLSASDPPPTLSIFLQGGGTSPLLTSTMYAYIPLLSALLLRKGVPLCQPSAETSPLP